MKKDRLIVMFFEILLIIILFFALFLPNIISRITLALILLVYMFCVYHSLKKRNIHSIVKKQVLYTMLAFAIVYVLGFYFMGVHFGFANSTIKFGFYAIYRYIIPTTIIVVSSEIIRSIFLAQKNKSSKWLTLISMVLIDLIVYTNVYNLTTLDRILSTLGLVLFASISCNLLYNYISVRFGHAPIIVYRLITILYIYIIPVVPDVYVFFRSFLRMLYPYIIYLVLENTYSKSNLALAYKDKKKSVINTTIITVLITLIIMLVSCQFKYGILVIGSESMTGSINKGDAVVFEAYEGQKIYEQNVIIFKSENMQVVHRVLDVKYVNGEYRYYTKGDANENYDVGYVTDRDIIGVVKFKIKYIGYPTLLIREMLA